MSENDGLLPTGGSTTSTRGTGDAYLLESEERTLNDEEAAEMDRNLRIVERFNTIRHLVERKSDDPFGAVWRELQRFSGDDAARRVMAARNIGDDVRLRGLRNEVRLADAFYISYRDADEVIDPMLLYYGAFSLAKAVCYATLSHDEYTVWRRRPAHGISSKIGSSLTDSSIMFQNNGTSQAFSQALAGHAPKDITMKAVDLFRAIPELHVLLKDLGLGGTSAISIALAEHDEIAARIFRCQECISLWIDDDQYTNDDFEREVPIFHALAARGVRLAIPAREISWDAKSGGHADLYSMSMRTPEGLFFERRLPGGWYVPEMAVHLIILHLLSDYARYRPAEWIDMVDRHTDEYALAREFIHVSEYKFPNLVLNELTQKNYMFAHY